MWTVPDVASDRDQKFSHRNPAILKSGASINSARTSTLILRKFEDKRYNDTQSVLYKKQKSFFFLH